MLSSAIDTVVPHPPGNNSRTLDPTISAVFSQWPFALSLGDESIMGEIPEAFGVCRNEREIAVVAARAVDIPVDLSTPLSGLFCKQENAFEREPPIAQPLPVQMSHSRRTGSVTHDA